MLGNYEFDDVRKLETDVGVLELELLNGKRVLQRRIGIHMPRGLFDFPLVVWYKQNGESVGEL